MINLTITGNEGNQRLDRFLKKYLDGAPLSLIYKMIRKDVKINGKRGTPETMLSEGDKLTIYIDEKAAEGLKKNKVHHKVKRQFKIVYEDENILICDKPFGLLTHGDKTEKKNHLANQVIDYLIETGSYNPRVEKTFVPAPANRLDRNTTGLVVFGKTAPALQELNKMIREKTSVGKYYLTIVLGKLESELHLVDRMEKDGERNLVKVIDSKDEGKLMETIARPVVSKYYNNRWFTLVEVEIVTGRTHQIRVHLSKAGYPIIGDAKYGNANLNKWSAKNLKHTTQLLHAYKLIFNKCDEKGPLAELEGRVIEGEIPEEFKRIKEEIFGKI